MKKKCYLSVGSNLDDRAGFCRNAIDLLAKTPGIRIESVSSFYETPPVGVKEQPDFINLALKVETDIGARQLLDIIKDIEIKLGRVRTEKWGPRKIDIDIVFYGDDLIEEEGLSIPHPAAMERAFVLLPLLEIDKDLCHPLTGKAIKDQLLELQDTKSIIKLESSKCI